MAIDKIFNDANVDGIADNIFGAVNNSVSEVKQMQQRKAAENVQMVVEALKKIETNITEKFDNVTDVIEKRVLTIKDGRDGSSGSDGRNGRDGKPGRDGANGKQGTPGTPGKDGVDGVDGVSVTDANIDFDGSLVISLSTGQQINVGEIVPPELERQLVELRQGGGSAGSSGDVAGPTSSTDNAIVRFDGTTGKLVQNSVVTIADTTGNMAGVGTLGVGAITTTGALVGTATQNAFNSVSTTLNLGGAATAVNVGAATGTLTVANTTLAAKAITASTTLGVTGATTLSSTLSLGGTVSGGGNQINNVIIGTTTPLAGAFTTLSATGIITSTVTSGQVLKAESGTTGILYSNFVNTGGTFLYGIDNSAGTAIFSGSSAYAGFIGTTTATSLVLATNSVARGVFSSTGLAVTGTLSATSNIYTSARYFAQRLSSSLNLAIGGYSDGSAATVLTGAIGDIVAFGNVGGDGVIFANSNTERMRLTDTGLGIGTSSPSQKLEVSGTILAKTTSTPAIIARSTSTGIKVFYDDGRTEFTAVNYDGLSTVGAQDLFITSGQKATFGVNSASSIIYPLEITTAGVLSIPYGQIQFPATQNASANANTLDDYEEGDWTASFVPNTSGTITLSANTGTYTKVGRVVTISGNFIVSSVSSPTGYLKIAGLPFAGGGNAKFRCAISIDGSNMNATMTTVLTATIQGDSNIYVFKPDGLGGQSLTTAADMKATTQIFIGGTYTID